MDAGTAHVQGVPAGRHGALGPQLRACRIERGVGLRELARRLRVSPSLISQIETGKLTPSVSTLFAILNELGVALDQVFPQAEGEQGAGGRAVSGALRPADGIESADAVTGAGGPRGPKVAPNAERRGRTTSAPDGRATAAGARHQGTDLSRAPRASTPERSGTGRHDPVQRAGDRSTITMATGVRWDRLTSVSDPEVDFLQLTYEVGAASSEGEILMRHPGREYGIVIEGVLGITIGFDDYELRPGDSISFDSTVPHRFWNAGETVVQAVWFVVGRQPPPGSAAGGGGPHHQL